MASERKSIVVVITIRVSGRTASSMDKEKKFSPMAGTMKVTGKMAAERDSARISPWMEQFMKESIVMGIETAKENSSMLMAPSMLASGKTTKGMVRAKMSSPQELYTKEPMKTEKDQAMVNTLGLPVLCL